MATTARLAPAGIPSTPPPTRRASVLALAAVEGRRFVRHPLFLAGTAFTGIVYFLNTGDTPNDAYLGVTGVGFVGPAVALLVVANLATLRERRHEAVELVDPAPVPPHARTVALLVALAAPVAVATGVVLASATAVGVWSGAPVLTPAGVVDQTPSLPELMAGPAAVAFAGALGVALGRLVPSAVASLAAAGGLFFGQMPLLFWEVNNDARWFAPFVSPLQKVGWKDASDGGGLHVVAGVDAGALGWHAAYLVGAAILLGGLAVLAHIRRRAVVATVAAGFAVAVAAGALQVGAARGWACC